MQRLIHQCLHVFGVVSILHSCSASSTIIPDIASSIIIVHHSGRSLHPPTLTDINLAVHSFQVILSMAHTVAPSSQLTAQVTQLPDLPPLESPSSPGPFNAQHMASAPATVTAPNMTQPVVQLPSGGNALAPPTANQNIEPSLLSAAEVSLPPPTWSAPMKVPPPFITTAHRPINAGSLIGALETADLIIRGQGADPKDGKIKQYAK